MRPFYGLLKKKATKALFLSILIPKT